MIIPVVLSGGVGSRLWPLSRRSMPKQLHVLTGGRSLIQTTMERVGTAERRIVVCGPEVVDGIAEQLDPAGLEILIEPEGRNTAPAITAAAVLADPEDVLVVLPADHVIKDEDGFREKLDVATAAAQDGHLVTFGVTPRRPETGYGYIRAGDRVDEGWLVERFVEKPDSRSAMRMVSSGRYLWNSGMFVATASLIIEEVSRQSPELFDAVDKSAAASSSDGNRIVLGDEFLSAPSVSFDTAVMENTANGIVIPLDAGWSDVGSWAALWELGTLDENENVIRGDVLAEDTTGSYLRSESRVVAVVGLDDIVVVETPDAVLVASRDRANEVKDVVERLADRPETH
ncbi:MAG: mannose-1-phosphate guanylyltransferase/mannose-6-phosphate isomerase [Acidimicrobiia bacterium]|nr:mannose-1-phosphate guanylyltransferase/mannose-6-phosphate isomerase [Acidimicrobiia bacterium]